MRSGARLRIGWIAAALLAVVLVVGGVAALDAALPGIVTPRLVAEIERATGRRVTLSGPVGISLLPAPAVVARDVSISNPPGFGPAPMAHARVVRASIDLLALLAGRLDIESLSLVDPVVALERRPDGVANWVFRPDRPAAPASDGGTGPHRRVGLRIESVDAAGGHLSWSDAAPVHGPGGGARLGTGGFDLVSLHAQVQDSLSSFTLALHGRHAGNPFGLSLAAGSPERFRAADAKHPYPVRATLDFGPDGENVVTIDGVATDPASGRGCSGRIVAHLQSLQVLERLFPRAGLPRSGRIDADAAVRTDPNGRPGIGRFALRVDGADLGSIRSGLMLARLEAHSDASDAPIAIVAAGTDRGMPFDLRSSAFGTPDLWSRQDGRGRVAADVSLDGATASLSGTLARGSGLWSVQAMSIALHGVRLDRLVPGDAAGGSTTRALGPLSVDAIVDASVGPDGLSGRTSATGLVSGESRWPDAVWTVRDVFRRTLEVTASNPSDPALLRWDQDLASRPNRIAVSVAGHDLPAGPLARTLIGLDGLTGRLALRTDLRATSRGRTIDPASLSGPLDALLTEAELDGGLARRLIAGVVGRTPLLPQRLGSQRIHCANAIGRFAGGTLTLAQVSLDTPLLGLDGRGTVALGPRTLSLSLSPQIRLGPATASAPMTLSGPIDDPQAGFARNASNRFDLSIGNAAATRPVACDLVPGVGIPVRKPTNAVDLLHRLGLFR